MQAVASTHRDTVDSQILAGGLREVLLPLGPQGPGIALGDVPFPDSRADAHSQLFKPPAISGLGRLLVDLSYGFSDRVFCRAHSNDSFEIGGPLQNAFLQFGPTRLMKWGAFAPSKRFPRYQAPNTPRNWLRGSTRAFDYIGPLPVPSGMRRGKASAAWRCVPLPCAAVRAAAGRLTATLPVRFLPRLP